MLRCYPNTSKLDTARYASMRMHQLVNAFVGKLYFTPDHKIRTTGLGQIAGQARHFAEGVIRQHRALVKATKQKSNVPNIRESWCLGRLEKASGTSFDYWLRVSNEWTAKKCVRLPVKANKAFNRALRDGWYFNPICEFKIVRGMPYARVFVQKIATKCSRPSFMLGADIGIKHAVVFSDGHLGHGLHPVMIKQKNRIAERQRQKHKKFKQRTEVKQILDREAKILLRRSKQVGAGLAVEDPRVLGNLKSGTLHGWARSYFANRVHTLGREQGVLVLDINPAYTSQTCSKCGIVDKESRVSRDLFTCKVCGHSQHADVNAARNIALKGTQILNEKLLRFRRSD